MKDYYPKIDRNLHLMYSKEAKAVVLNDIFKRYGEKENGKLFYSVNEKYAEFLKTQPSIGGKKNPQAQSVYDCILLFAYYEVSPQKPTLDELEELNNKLFTEAYQRVKFIDLNHPLLLKAANGIFKHVEKVSNNISAEFPANYHMEMLPFSKEMGIRYKFHSCPIADFAKAHGYNDLMPAFCNGDYPMLSAIHAGLIREYTCSNGEYCDYQIVGSSSPLLEKHPAKRREDGYIFNDLTDSRD